MRYLALLLLAFVLGCTRAPSSATGEAELALLHATVRLQCAGRTGAGTVIFSDSSRSLILTANHVTEGGLPVSVELYTWTRDGQDTFSFRSVPARVVSSAPAFDLSLLEIDVGSLPFVPVLYLDPLPRGLPVVISGCPTAIDPLLSYGAVSDPFFTDRTFDAGTNIWFIASAPIFFGNSGGGVFAKVRGSYYLIGVASIMRFAPHLGGHIHPIAIRSFLES